MAGGKLSPRQKMINLMYLVFIAMLALNMSKEVLSAFGSINEKLGRANTSYEQKNSLALADLSKKANENEKFKDAAATANSAQTLSDEYYNYVESQKQLLLSDVKDPTDYEAMDKSQFLDELYFKGGKLTPEGEQFKAEMDKYRNGMVALIGTSNPAIADQIKRDFDTSDIEDGEGVKKDYISYNFVGFPSVSSLTKMTQIQNDVKTVQNELLSKLLSGNLKSLASIEENYETVMTTTKGAYYTSDTFDGVLSLGRVDASTKPSRVELKIDGRPISESQYTFEGGKLALKMGAGGVGDHTITGSLFYPQDGEDVEVKVDKKYTTISKPNAATIAADKMNVVYRGVANPMTITFAGIESKDISASAAGLSKSSGSKYTMTPGSGREVTINVSGKLPNGGGTVTDAATFRIKDIPRPTGTIRGEDGDGGCVRMQREGLEKSSVGAALQDFDFDLNLNVTGFSFKVSGQPTIKVNGRKLDGAASGALRRAKRGETVQIFDINANIAGNSGYKLKKISPICIELTN
ncbi:MAG: gliding motility protein GldM [Patiriisocius sp.]|uniref:type IX secretion system motor protein PorM/GldM n=1 Tax=Patiriisocius sp. TaxID=2822396 RepID=UPI003EF08FD9